MAATAAIIGAAVAAGTAIYGAVQAKKANDAAKEHYKEQKRRNAQWRDRYAYETMTQRADAQRAMSLLEGQLRDKISAGRSAVMGESDAAAAIDRESAMRAAGDTVANIAVTGDAARRQVEEVYEQKQEAASAGLAGLEQQRAQNIAGSVQTFGNATANILGAVGEYQDQKALRQKQANDTHPGAIKS